jgi:hypothetical protein
MRYRKTVTTVNTAGGVSVEKRGLVDEYDLERDREEEHERITAIARSGPVGRIVTVESLQAATVVIYDTGLTKIINWVAVPE